MAEPQRIAIIGAGPVGALCALMLSTRFEQAEILLVDARPDPRLPTSFTQGRSINLAFSHRGIEAISSVDPELCDRVKRQGVVMRGRMLHKGSKGDLEPQDYGLYDQGEYLRSVSRTAVNSILLDGVDKCPRVKIEWQTKLVEMDLRKERGVEVTLAKLDGSNQDRRRFDLVVGADGAYSMTRRQMMRAPKSRFDFSQEYATHDYMELSMPAGKNGRYKMPESYLHIWPRKELMLIALPNQDQSFTMTLFATHDQFEALRGPSTQGKQPILELFREHFPDALELIGEQGVLDCWRKNPVDGLVETRVAPHHFDGKVVLLGDAGHAMVPFYGQGMNCGLEDVRVLAALLDRHLGRPSKLPESSLTPSLDSLNLKSVSDVLSAYSTVRIPSTSAMQRFAHANYQEMAAAVLDPFYLVRRAIDMTLARFLPDGKWDSLYRMVTFRPNLAYEEVEKRRQWQSVVLRRIMQASLATVVSVAGVGGAWYLRAGRGRSSSS